jgi:hypothetical protein
MSRESIKQKGNLYIHTTIQDEGNFHSWKCILRAGSWELKSWGEGGSFEKYECTSCHAIKSVRRYRFRRYRLGKKMIEEENANLKTSINAWKMYYEMYEKNITQITQENGKQSTKN